MKENAFINSYFSFFLGFISFMGSTLAVYSSERSFVLFTSNFPPLWDAPSSIHPLDAKFTHLPLRTFMKLRTVKTSPYDLGLLNMIGFLIFFLGGGGSDDIGESKSHVQPSTYKKKNISINKFCAYVNTAFVGL